MNMCDEYEEGSCNRRKKLLALILTVGVIVCIIIAVVVATTSSKSEFSEHAPYAPYQSAMVEFFNLTDGIELKFAHAVNSKAKLNESLADPTVMVLEADILIDPVSLIPIMAHPPANSSDLTLREFLATSASHVTPKGVKLDFKQIGVVEPSLRMLKESRKNHTGVLPPTILNADILEGPENPLAVPVDARKFLSLCKTYDNTSIISPGWTTTKPKNPSSPEGYSWKMVDEMYALVKELKQPLTFPVRASLISSSKNQLMWLLKQKDNYSLTVWHSNVDQYDVRDFAFLRSYPTKIFYDLPEEKINKLKQYFSR